MMMNPYQSWTSMVLLLALVAAVIWLIREIGQMRADRQSNNSSGSESTGNNAGPTRTRLAVVTDLRTRRRVRHLTLVENPPQAPYDWQTHGI